MGEVTGEEASGKKENICFVVTKTNFSPIFWGISQLKPKGFLSELGPRKEAVATLLLIEEKVGFILPWNLTFKKCSKLVT